MSDQREAVRRAWDAVADDYARRRRADGEDARLVDDLLASLPPEARVLDVGCGDGMRTLANMVGADAVGLDVSRRQCELARSNVPHARVVQGEMTNLPFAADAFDALTAYHAVFHVSRGDHPRVYDEFARVCRSGGLVLTTVGRGRTDTTRRNWLDSGHSMYWSTPGRDATLGQLREAGFEVRWERLVDDPLGSEALFVLAERVP